MSVSRIAATLGWTVAGLGCPIIALPQPALNDPAWSVQAGLRSVLDSNIEHDDEARGAAGGVFEGEVEWKSRGDPSVSLGYRLGIHCYTRTEPWNRVSHEFQSVYQRPVSPITRLAMVAAARFNGASEDRDVSDSYVVGPRLDWHPDGPWRIRLFPAYRHRRFEDRDYDYAHQPFVEIEVRHEGTDGAQWRADARFDARFTPTADDRYRRWRQRLEYRHPLNRDDRLHVQVEYRFRRYPHRLVETADGSTLRVDHQWGTAIRWEHRLAPDLDVSASYEFDVRSSNEDDKGFSAHRLTVGIETDWPFGL